MCPLHLRQLVVFFVPSTRTSPNITYERMNWKTAWNDAKIIKIFPRYCWKESSVFGVSVNWCGKCSHFVFFVCVQSSYFATHAVISLIWMASEIFEWLVEWMCEFTQDTFEEKASWAILNKCAQVKMRLWLSCRELTIKLLKSIQYWFDFKHKFSM